VTQLSPPLYTLPQPAFLPPPPRLPPASPTSSHPPIPYHFTHRSCPSRPLTSLPNEPSCFVSCFSKPATYRDAVAYPEWQFSMVEEIAALECTVTWDLVPQPPSTISIMYKWAYKIKTTLMALLSAIKCVLLLAVFSNRMIVTMRRLLLLFLIGPLFILLLWWPLFVVCVLSLSLT
jgi:hypothetical protein